MVAMVAAGDATLIDVRSDSEILATGSLLPQARAIPVEAIAEGALAMDDEDFADEWGFEKVRLLGLRIHRAAPSSQRIDPFSSRLDLSRRRKTFSFFHARPA